MVSAAKLGKRVLEICDHRATHEPGGLQRPSKYFRQLRLKFSVRRDQIKKRYLTRLIVNGAHFVTSTVDWTKRKNLAGFPATMLFAGTSLVTTLPAPTMAFSPTVTLAKIVEPEPIEEPFFTKVRSTFQSASVWSAPSVVVARG